jgi:hypothetical protein
VIVDGCSRAKTRTVPPSLTREIHREEELLGSLRVTAEIAVPAVLDGRYTATSSLEKEVGGARMPLLVGDSQRSVAVDD